VVLATLQLHYPGERDSVPVVQENENLAHTGIRSPDTPTIVSKKIPTTPVRPTYYKDFVAYIYIYATESL
jgi:hypothetical protein